LKLAGASGHTDTMKAHCPSCRRPLVVAPEHYGTRLECPHCGAGFTAGARPAVPLAQEPPRGLGRGLSAAVWGLTLAAALAALAGVVSVAAYVLSGPAAATVAQAQERYVALIGRAAWVGLALAALWPLYVAARAVEGITR
jgi:hypothetical protein